MKRMHLELFGHVQGVAFRAYTMREARSYSLNGWVRNRPDGSVEVIAEGAEEQLRQLRDYCSHGPPTARVSQLEEEWLDYVGDVGPFSIRYA
jgi:acylphosphatase